MSIAILTLNPADNYGGILQAWALQTILERMGHEVTVIAQARRKRQMKLWKAPLILGKRTLKNMLGRPTPLLLERKWNREHLAMWQYTLPFINKYIHLKQYEDLHSLQPQEYDAYVVGSDQVWRPEYFYYHPQEAFLNFTHDWPVKRIAYAASFGSNKWLFTGKQTKECAELAKKFDFISVREDDGVTLCREHLGVEAVHVLDPTMLLSKENYLQLIPQGKTYPCGGNLMTYILDDNPEKKALVERIAKEKGLTPFRVGAKSSNLAAPLEDRIQHPVEQWLRGFQETDFVVTDSFHGTVFSILFGKPFITIGNEGRGMSRFTSLVKMLGVEGRMLTTHSPLPHGEIDFDKVHEKLEQQRKVAYQFLRQGLGIKVNT